MTHKKLSNTYVLMIIQTLVTRNWSHAAACCSKSDFKIINVTISKKTGNSVPFIMILWSVTMRLQKFPWMIKQ